MCTKTTFCSHIHEELDAKCRNHLQDDLWSWFLMINHKSHLKWHMWTGFENSCGQTRPLLKTLPTESHHPHREHYAHLIWTQWQVKWLRFTSERYKWFLNVAYPCLYTFSLSFCTSALVVHGLIWVYLSVWNCLFHVLILGTFLCAATGKFPNLRLINKVQSNLIKPNKHTQNVTVQISRAAVRRKLKVMQLPERWLKTGTKSSVKRQLKLIASLWTCYVIHLNRI